MLVARNYGSRSCTRNEPDLESQRPTMQKKTTRQHKEEKRGFGWRPASYEEHVAQFKSVNRRANVSSSVEVAALVPRQSTSRYRDVNEFPRGGEETLPEISTSRSRPLAIPSRSRLDSLRPVPAQQRRSVSHISSARNGDQAHDSRAVPASVAALLAMTAIPKKNVFARPRPNAFSARKMSSQDLVEEWKQLDIDEASFDPNMEILLSPPGDEDISFRTTDNESFDQLSYARSRSISDGSTPSLDHDQDSSLSWSVPSTPVKIRQHPRSGTAVNSSPKERCLSLPTSVDCASDHPLLEFAEPEYFNNSPDAPRAFKSPPRSPPPTPPSTNRPPPNPRSPSSTLKSNLTLSLAALRQAARTFSNFAAPSLSVLPDDHLSRGLFGDHRGQHPAYPSEMRPKPLAGVPTPEMRRYLNPLHHLAPGDFHLHGAVWDHTDLEAVAAATVSSVLGHVGADAESAQPAVIKMQTYIPAGAGKRVEALTSSLAKPPAPGPTSTPPSGSPFALPLRGAAAAAVEQTSRPRREPRENGDFLRVCVMEMRMRRAGKLEMGVGRARFWLPAREGGGEIQGEMVVDVEVEVVEVNGGQEGMVGKRRKVPRRWVGVCVA